MVEFCNVVVINHRIVNLLLEFWGLTCEFCIILDIVILKQFIDFFYSNGEHYEGDDLPINEWLKKKVKPQEDDPNSIVQKVLKKLDKKW